MNCTSKILGKIIKLYMQYQILVKLYETSINLVVYLFLIKLNVKNIYY